LVQHTKGGVNLKNPAILTIIAILIQFGVFGCNAISGPSDKIINETITSRSLPGMTFTNVTVMEKGNRLSNGRYPVKVHYEMTLDGRVMQMEGIKYFYEGQDPMGKSIWMSSNSPS